MFWEGARSPDGLEDWLNWVAFLRDTQTPVGTFQATVPKTGDASLAYTVFSAFWRQGYAREMALCVIPHLFATYEMPGLYAEVDTRNAASIRLLESLDFQRVRTTRDADHFKGSSSDEYTYRRARASWQAAE